MLPQSLRIVKTVSQPILFVYCFHSGRYEVTSLTTCGSLPRVAVLSNDHSISIISHHNDVFVLVPSKRAPTSFDDISAKADDSMPFTSKGEHVAQDSSRGNSVSRTGASNFQWLLSVALGMIDHKIIGAT